MTDAADIPDNNPRPNPFDPKTLSVGRTGGEIFPVTKLLTAVPVRKPKSKEWVRSHPSPDFAVTVALLEMNPGEPPYIVTPDVAAAFHGEVNHRELRLAINQQGVIFLWPQPVIDPNGREIQWHTTHRMAAERAKTEWVRMTSDLGLGAYQIHIAEVANIEPVWPEYSLSKLLEVAFAGRLVDSTDHPVIRQLLGRA